MSRHPTNHPETFGVRTAGLFDMGRLGSGLRNIGLVQATIPGRWGRLVATLLVLAMSWTTAACSDDSEDQAGDPALDGRTTILAGPYLQAPGQGTVTVMWYTDLRSGSRVEFGPTDAYGSKAQGRTFQQEPDNPDELISGNPLSGWMHEVRLTGLQPGQTIHYRVLSAPQPTQDASFLVQNDSAPFSFLVFGDTRTDNDTHAQVIATMVREVPASLFAVNSGDLVTMGDSENQWLDFFRIEAPLISHTPLLAVFGNHELTLGRTKFQAFFKAPPSSSSDSDLHYSYDVGSLHLAVADVYEDQWDPNRAWLEEDLRASRAVLKVVVIHPPLYTFSNHPPDLDLRSWLVPLCQETGVQVVFSGHNHGYEHFFGQGIHFVITAGGGAPLYDVDAHPEYDSTGAQRIVGLSAYHFVRGDVSGDTMRLEALSVPDATRIDCFQVDPAQPGENLTCD